MSTLLSLVSGRPLEHARYRAQGVPWLYEMSEVASGEMAADDSTIAIFRAVTGDRSRSIVFRAFPSEAGWNVHAAPTGAERVVTELLKPAPFSVLR
jgi:hypothetical protein